MLTLLDEQFAPTTQKIGFLQAPLETATGLLIAWGNELGHAPMARRVGGLVDGLRALEPLVGGARPRELLMAVGDEWTAYFDCGLGGTDAVSAMGALAQKTGLPALAIMAVPHARATGGQYGAVHFELFGPTGPEPLKYVRSVTVTHDGSRWVFWAGGEVQPYEETERYRVRRARERFTSEMLERYCRRSGSMSSTPPPTDPVDT